MVRLGTLLVGSDAVAEELVQDALVAVHRRWSSVDNPGRVPAHLGGQRLPVPPAVLGPGAAARTPARRGRPARGRRGVGRLGPAAHRQRVALVLRYYDDASEADIARALGVRPPTVRSLLNRGLAKLRKEIERRTSKTGCGPRWPGGPSGCRCPRRLGPHRRSHQGPPARRTDARARRAGRPPRPGRGRRRAAGSGTGDHRGRHRPVHHPGHPDHRFPHHGATGDQHVARAGAHHHHDRRPLAEHHVDLVHQHPAHDGGTPAAVLGVAAVLPGRRPSRPACPRGRAPPGDRGRGAGLRLRRPGRAGRRRRRLLHRQLRRRRGPLRLLASAEARGERPLWYLARLLELPYGVQAPAGGSEAAPTYLWPAAATGDEDDWSAISEAGLYSEEELEAMQRAGSGYLGYRLGITAEGDWLFLVAGD